MKYNNVLNGFVACDFWCSNVKSVHPKRIRVSNITNIDFFTSREESFESYIYLYKYICKNRHKLVSDGRVYEKGFLNTEKGALLNCNEYLAALLRAEDEASQKILDKESRDRGRAIIKNQSDRVHEEMHIARCKALEQAEERQVESELEAIESFLLKEQNDYSDKTHRVVKKSIKVALRAQS